MKNNNELIEKYKRYISNMENQIKTMTAQQALPLIAKISVYKMVIIENGSALTNKSQTIVATIYKENAKSMIKRNKKGLLVIIDDMYKNRPERIYEDKAPTLRSERSGLKVKNEYEVRKLSVVECERLQNVPDNYTDVVSDTQRYKMLGNGWTVDVIAHIFSSLKGGEIFNNFSNENV